MTPMRPLTQPELFTSLHESLHYTAHVWRELPQGLELAEQSYKHIIGCGLDHLPLCLVFDVAILLNVGQTLSLRSQHEYSQWSEDERVIRLRYESELICRLATLPQVNELIELGRIGALPLAPLLRALELICRAIGDHLPRGRPIPRRILRQIEWSRFEKSGDDTDDQGESFEEESSEKTQQSSSVSELLDALLDTLSQSLNWGELLSDVDLFELRHWERLYTEDLRIGCRQLLELSERLGELKVNDLVLPREDAELDTQFSDDTIYPTGGITELTTSGSWENLVLSELIYIDDANPHEVDLFDVRFVENELLFYLRDEGQLSSKRRRVDFIIDLAGLFRQKTSGYEFQFSIIICGLIYRLIHDLSVLYHGDALSFLIHGLSGDQDPQPLREELRLLQLLLVDEEQRGLVSFDLLKDLDDQSLIDHRRKRYAVVFTHESSRASWSTRLATWREDEGVSGCCLSIGAYEGVVAVNEETRPGEPIFSELRLPLSGLSIAELSDLKRLLAAQLINGSLTNPLKLAIIEADECVGEAV